MFSGGNNLKGTPYASNATNFCNVNNNGNSNNNNASNSNGGVAPDFLERQIVGFVPSRLARKEIVSFHRTTVVNEYLICSGGRFLHGKGCVINPLFHAR
jgi:hypothetical protein